MQPLDIVDQALEMPDNGNFQTEMRAELQSRILEFSEDAWLQLNLLVKERTVDWQRKLCLILSPLKHGKHAKELLLSFVETDPETFWAICVARLLSQQVLSDAERQHLSDLYTEIPLNLHKENQNRFEAGLLRQLQEGPTTPPISEASEYSIYHKTALEASEMAACYECLQVFPVAEISEFTDAGETALCPFCGIDAVLPDTAGYPFTQEMLEALHEYWFR